VLLRGQLTWAYAGNTGILKSRKGPGLGFLRIAPKERRYPGDRVRRARRRYAFPGFRMTSVLSPRGETRWPVRRRPRVCRHGGPARFLPSWWGRPRAHPCGCRVRRARCVPAHACAAEWTPGQVLRVPPAGGLPHGGWCVRGWVDRPVPAPDPLVSPADLDETFMSLSAASRDGKFVVGPTR